MESRHRRKWRISVSLFLLAQQDIQVSVALQKWRDNLYCRARPVSTCVLRFATRKFHHWLYGTMRLLLRPSTRAYPRFVISPLRSFRDDSLVPATDIKNWINTLEPKPEILNFEHASHFFHGKLIDLRQKLIESLKHAHALWTLPSSVSDGRIFTR